MCSVVCVVKMARSEWRRMVNVERSSPYNRSLIWHSKVIPGPNIIDFVYIITVFQGLGPK